MVRPGNTTPTFGHHAAGTIHSVRTIRTVRGGTGIVWPGGEEARQRKLACATVTRRVCITSHIVTQASTAVHAQGSDGDAIHAIFLINPLQIHRDTAPVGRELRRRECARARDFRHEQCGCGVDAAASRAAQGSGAQRGGPFGALTGGLGEGIQGQRLAVLPGQGDVQLHVRVVWTELHGVVVRLTASEVTSGPQKGHQHCRIQIPKVLHHQLGHATCRCGEHNEHVSQTRQHVQNIRSFHKRQRLAVLFHVSG
mmetsp:Transcript_33831/g.58090  ORF Transcript_33831/g.58090 Transcript_33831/m.58090 type:complete len:254 (+) Transcript_33831:261-1022(+)